MCSVELHGKRHGIGVWGDRRRQPSYRHAFQVSCRDFILRMNNGRLNHLFKQRPFFMGTWICSHRISFGFNHRCELITILYTYSSSFCKQMLTKICAFMISAENWMGVSFDEFSRCDSNLATNRQTRMLSDLSLIGCYNKSSMPAHERDRIMLASAKRNIAAMSYFGLTEYQKVSSILFPCFI